MSSPIPLNEEARLAELRRFAVLDTAPEKAFDRITELAMRIFDVPISTVTRIDEKRQWFKSCFGLDVRQTGRNIAFCAHAILTDEVSLGLELARQHRPDLILLDLHLPDMLGDEVLRQLRADPATSAIPVVMISADATAAQNERFREAGAEDYLTKPIDVRRFLAVIDAVEPRHPEAATVTPPC